LKRIIIIAYYFSPGKTPTNRVKSWLDFFPQLGYYPIILTRATTGDDIGITKVENGEIHRIKASPLFSERIALKKIPSLLKLFLLKVYSMTIWTSKYDKTYQSFNQYFTENLAKNGDRLLITGSPFNLFKIGYNYSKRYSGDWIADYRDMWNLSDMPKFFDTYVEKLYRQTIALGIEKKWINTASHITTVSDYLGEKLRRITNTKVSIIENGFFEAEHQHHINVKKNDVLSFVYIGSIYKTQQIDKCLHALNEAFEKELTKGRFVFVGSSFSKKLRQFINNWDSDFLEIEIIPKVPKEQCLAIQTKCHLGIMCSYGAKGIPASKLYEFLGMRQLVFLYPSDNDVIEDTLKKSGLGYCYSDYDSAVKGARELIRKFNQFGKIEESPNQEFINQFSRRNLVNKYVEEVLDEKKSIQLNG